MIDDLSRSLAALLKGALDQDLAGQLTVSFAAPDDRFRGEVSPPAVNFFLYDVRENLELRRNDVTRTPTGSGTVALAPAPVYVDCSYLVTAWASDSSQSQALDEQRILGQVMRVLLRHKALPKDVLKGRLADGDPPKRALPLQESLLQSPGEFWQAIGGKPKPTFNYTVTVGMSVFEPSEAPMATESVIRLKRIAGEGSQS